MNALLNCEFDWIVIVESDKCRRPKSYGGTTAFRAMIKRFVLPTVNIVVITIIRIPYDCWLISIHVCFVIACSGSNEFKIFVIAHRIFVLSLRKFSVFIFVRRWFAGSNVQEWNLSEFNKGNIRFGYFFFLLFSSIFCVDHRLFWLCVWLLFATQNHFYCF